MKSTTGCAHNERIPKIPNIPLSTVVALCDGKYPDKLILPILIEIYCSLLSALALIESVTIIDGKVQYYTPDNRVILVLR